MRQLFTHTDPNNRNTILQQLMKNVSLNFIMTMLIKPYMIQKTALPEYKRDNFAIHPVNEYTRQQCGTHFPHQVKIMLPSSANRRTMKARNLN
jgi:hypothetical protein